MDRTDWNVLRAWWHRRVLGHDQDPKTNDGDGPPRILCYCWRRNRVAVNRAREFHV